MDVHALNGKKIILGISGSIAAYKTAFIVRLLIKAGAEVQVIMTEAATTFITPLTLSTLSKNPVWSKVSSEGSWNNHVEMGLWADAMVIAPTTATTLSKLANGLCDNMLAAVYLSGRCPVFIAPAMDVDMWLHPSTQANIKKLQSYGNQLIPVGVGELASGLSGAGRMAEPEEILEYLSAFFNRDQVLKGRKILITAGPTHEAIDPVRFIGNRSTGRMGIALAEQAAEQGAEVELVLGPTHLRPSHSGINVHLVESAQQMFDAAVSLYDRMDVAIMSAAVADYRPVDIAKEKLKKEEGMLNIELERTLDIAAHLGKNKKEHQLLVGFALETRDEVVNAKSKLDRKNFDFIVLNSLKTPGAGFKHDTNQVQFFFKDGRNEAFELKMKTEVAKDILRAVANLLSSNN